VVDVAVDRPGGMGALEAGVVMAGGAVTARSCTLHSGWGADLDSATAARRSQVCFIPARSILLRAATAVAPHVWTAKRGCQGLWVEAREIMRCADVATVRDNSSGAWLGTGHLAADGPVPQSRGAGCAKRDRRCG
jgi:hypothetical protein